jgi:glycosyltransferase involved in cell wall biosynthesis
VRYTRKFLIILKRAKGREEENVQFSVLMPVYKGDRPVFVEKAILSILNQSHKPTEVIIVIDGPIGIGLERIINRYKKEHKLIQTLKLETNQGLGVALQLGVQHCNYDIIARMDADDICRSDRFEKQIAFLKMNPEVDVVGSYIQEFDEDPFNEEEIIKKVPLKHKQIVKFSKKRNPLNHMTVMYKKSAVIDSGNYQPFLWFEDYSLWMRMIANGKKIHNIPEPLVYARTGYDMYMRRGGFQYLLNDVKLQWEFFKARYINLLELNRNIFLRAIVRVIPNSMRAKLYRNYLR